MLYEVVNGEIIDYPKYHLSNYQLPMRLYCVSI